MSARSALPPTGYKRPTEATLDHLVDTGTRGTAGAFGTTETSGGPGGPGDPGDPGDQGALGAKGVLGDRGASGTGGSTGTMSVSVAPGTSGAEGTAGNSDVSERRTEPRDHVKVRRSLAAEMRDAVWFLSEHGRPRVQLGELLDEALQAWLTEAKATHNGGESFPRRGRLR